MRAFACRARAAVYESGLVSMSKSGVPMAERPWIAGVPRQGPLAQGPEFGDARNNTVPFTSIANAVEAYNDGHKRLARGRLRRRRQHTASISSALRSSTVTVPSGAAVSLIESSCAGVWCSESSAQASLASTVQCSPTSALTSS